MKPLPIKHVQETIKAPKQSLITKLIRGFKVQWLTQIVRVVKVDFFQQYNV